MHPFKNVIFPNRHFPWRAGTIHQSLALDVRLFISVATIACKKMTDQVKAKNYFWTSGVTIFLFCPRFKSFQSFKPFNRFAP